ncbi:MAG TPA: DUF4431 domain-containing protein [Allosphingosinicella sp.]|nr:DUF4431 domain-containing protein [Allosphingosinicella sp.]
MTMPFLPLLILAAAQPATAQGCLDLKDGETEITLSGRLEARIFAGPPYYEDIRRGDARERAYILTLDRSICIDDGGEFADPRQRFDRVHLYTGTDAIRPRLRAGLGRRVRVRGSGFAAQTGHHRAPLVVDVSEIRVEGR